MPGWVVEILLPASSKNDLNEKYNLYEENGVREYWVVFPDSNAANQYVQADMKYENVNTFFKNDIISPSIFSALKIVMQEMFK